MSKTKVPVPCWIHGKSPLQGLRAAGHGRSTSSHVSWAWASESCLSDRRTAKGGLWVSGTLPQVGVEGFPHKNVHSVFVLFFKKRNSKYTILLARILGLLHRLWWSLSLTFLRRIHLLMPSKRNDQNTDQPGVYDTIVKPLAAHPW